MIQKKKKNIYIYIRKEDRGKIRLILFWTSLEQLKYIICLSNNPH